VLVEAMRAGKPVVASDIPGSGVGEVVSNGETGLLTPLADASALAMALERLVRDSGLRKQFGAAGRARFLAQFRIEPVAVAINAIYAEALAGHARPK
jgi:glycosyltransferase involved in cell wall biosynthesis